MQISVIIPTYNEERVIGRLLHFFNSHQHPLLEEVVVVDGGSSDRTVEIARGKGVCVHICAKKSRAHQMNYGAQLAKGNVLYFVHADTVPPETFLENINHAVSYGNKIGCFRSKFDSNKLLLKINGYCSRFERLMCRGGDQTMFITRTFFDELHGFDEYYIIMEEYDLIRRANCQEKFAVLNQEVEVSARKYDQNNYFRVNLANLIVFTMFRFGVNPVRLKETYQKLLNYQM